jgi:hypothetical protein
MDKEIQNPWDIEAHQLQSLRSCSLEEARNYIICVWLIISGDVRPFVNWSDRGHIPSLTVMKLMARMMCEGDDEHIPFILKIEKRGGGRGPKKSREAQIRDALIAANVDSLIETKGEKYNAAIDDIAKLSGRSKSSVRRAYDAYKKRNAN